MRIIQYFIPLLLITSCRNNETKQFDKALNCTINWFKAWELVSENVFKLPKQSLTRFVFFDSVYVYTTSPLTGQGGEEIYGPQLFDEKQTWYKKKHKGVILLPDSSTKRVQMMMFASQTREKYVKGYFVMPLISFWIKEKIDGNGVGLEKLTAGVFVHEFSHTTQLESFDKFGKYFETYQNKFGSENFGDDMMQNIFENDTIITSIYNQEMKLLIKARKSNITESKKVAKEALEIFYNKHKLILKNNKKDLKKLDDIWLTMEGIGQYAMYEYLVNPKGGNLTVEKASKAIKTRWWSQEEGYELFYLLAKFRKPETWANDFFGSDMKTIIEILEKEIK